MAATLPRSPVYTMSTYVPIILNESRTFQLTAYVPDPRTDEEKAALRSVYGGHLPARAHEQRVLKLLPGLNYANSADLEAARFVPGRGNVRAEVADPTKISDFAAMDLVERTASKSALGAWRASETRPAVCKAIDAKLDL